MKSDNGIIRDEITAVMKVLKEKAQGCVMISQSNNAFGKWIGNRDERYSMNQKLGR